MDEKEKKAIKKWCESIQDPIQLTLILTENDLSRQFDNYAKDFSQIASGIEFKTEKKNTTDPPSFQIGSNIFYHAVPRKKELDPFLEILSQTTAKKPNKTDGIAENEKIRIPAEVDLYIAIECGFCPTAVRKLSQLALKSELIRLSIIDAALFPEMAEENDIRSVPTTLLDQRYRWTGSFQETDILNMIIRRSPDQLSAGSIQNMLEDGAADKVAAMMIEFGEIFPSFYDLIVHDKWPLRLAAMVVMETIAETDTGLAATAEAPLMQRFDAVDPSVKGDLLYLLGIIGSPEIIDPLKSTLLDAEDPELKTALEEAISEILNRAKRLF